MKPRSTDCKAEALTAMPLRLLVQHDASLQLGGCMFKAGYIAVPLFILSSAYTKDVTKENNS